jgi:hypothetical protein
MRILHFALALILGCTAAATAPEPEGITGTGVPVGRSTHMRSGSFSYRLGDVERDGNSLRVDLRFSNGTHRNYRNVMLRVVVFGDGGEVQAARLPVGAILAEQTKPVVARIEGVTFRVQDVTLELIYAIP